jgi:hypothetical protein
MDWQLCHGTAPPTPTSARVYEDLPDFLPEERRRPIMSAAEPVPPVGALNGAATAHVIDIRSRQQPAGPGRWTMSEATPGGPTGQPDGVQHQLAEHLEVTFNDERMTLTDPDTRSVFDLTLRIVQGLLHGAAAEGIVDEGQRAELAVMMDGVASAPEHLG